jgi:Ser/Thr protein kinase RdoA (MazF antagonist)
MDEALPLTAARAFGIPAGPLRPVRGGASPLFDVTLADGRHMALRLHDPAGDRGVIEDGLRLAESLADAGFATPWPQRTRDDSLTTTVADRVASALQWVPATPLQQGQGDPARMHAIGALLADFHLTVAAVAPADLRLPDRSPSTPKIAAQGDPALTRAAAGLRAALSDQHDAPVGVVLDDPGAMLSGADGFWLIGVERAGIGWRAQDLAAALWPHADRPGLTALRDALIAGYVAGGGAARAAAPDRIALCLLLRALRAAATAPQDRIARTRVAACVGHLQG